MMILVYDIPFSSRIFYQSTSEANTYPFSQIGIEINADDLNDTGFVIGMNAEGHIVASKTVFNHKKIRNINLGSKFELIDLLVGCYSIINGGSTDPQNKSIKIEVWQIVVAVLASILTLVIFITIFCCCMKCSYCKNVGKNVVVPKSFREIAQLVKK